MENQTTCCFTGHRRVPDDQIPYIEQMLKDAILGCIQSGCKHFICGFASGTDLQFARIVIEFKGAYAITLEAAIPHAGRLRTPDPIFHSLLDAADKITILQEAYTKSCFLQRNRFMVDHSQVVIAVFDGRTSGGTFQTIRYAERLGVPIIPIPVATQ